MQQKRQGEVLSPAAYLILGLVLILGLLTSYVPHVLGADINVPSIHATIQEAINAAGPGDVIIVSSGIYYENIDFLGKAITVRSTDPNNWDIVASTIIDGNQVDRVVTFHQGEESDSVLSGFTLRNGHADSGGGIYCNGSSSPTITNCIITMNSAGSGAGITCGDESGLTFPSPTITNCRITENFAETNGGGIYCALISPVIRNCTISKNFSGTSGGGIYSIQSFLTINNSVINKNSTAGKGGGIYCIRSSQDPIPPMPSCLINCTIRGNSGKETGGGVYCATSPINSPVITNCIFWGNSPNEICRYNSYPAITYSNIQGGFSGQGNINVNPLFVDPNTGDFSLQYGSSCIDAGTNTGAPPKDKAGVTRPRDGNNDGLDVCDMGAYENILDPNKTAPVITCPDDITVEATGGLTVVTYPAVEVSDNDDPTPVVEYNPASGSGFPPGESTVTITATDSSGNSSQCSFTIVVTTYVNPGDSIQDAISAASDGDIITVAEGIYVEDIDFLGKAITLRSTNPDDPNVVAATIIDGDHEDGVVAFWNGEESDSVLSGFTIQNGEAEDFGGILCEGSSPTITHCIITENSAEYGGGGVSCTASSPTVTNCTISKNSATDGNTGGGIYCVFSSPIITNCLISENSVAEDGGGGIYCALSSPIISNCLISENSVEDDICGGIFLNYSPSAIINCTITRNSGEGVGGIFCMGPSPYILNSILWDNSPQNYYSTSGADPRLHYCNDYMTWATPSELAWRDPLFVDPNNGDFYLTPGTSPFIDAGHPFIYDGDGSRSDMGVYGGKGGSDLYRRTFTVATDESGDYTSIQDAIDNALTGDTITVFPGTYTENLQIIGKDISLISRDGPSTTIINGIGVSGGDTVIVLAHLGTGALLEGFTLQNGTILSMGMAMGGGIRADSSSLTIANCIITGNSGFYGGGISCRFSSPTITNCIINQNLSSSPGGGICCLFSSPIITHCLITENSADEGGGVNCQNSSPTIINCTITENSADEGGGIYCGNSSPVISNCTINKNVSSVNGGGIYEEDSSPTIINCILWGDLPNEIHGETFTITYSDIQGGYEATGNINDNPLFIDPNTGDYHLQSTSPCIDAGTDIGAPSTDMDGVSRPQDGDENGAAVCDMGAYEFTYPVSPPASPTNLSITGPNTLTWEANTEADLAGYYLYYKIGSSTPYEDKIDIDDPNATVFPITGLSATETYFLVLTAYNTMNLESGPSNEVMLLKEVNVSNISSSTQNGCYKAGDTIQITINFSDEVTLTGGNLVVTLDTGHTIIIEPFTSEAFINLIYTPQEGDTSSDLDVLSLTLSGGTLRNSEGTDCNLSLPSGNNVADTKNIVIDTTAPSIICPDDIILASEGVLTTVIYPTAQVSDTMDTNPDIIYNPSGSEFSPGETTVTALATDAAGNSSQCTFTVTVRDPLISYVVSGGSIQEAINKAIDGDVIIVTEGIYKENIDYLGKAITLRGTDPDDQDVVAATIIDGNQAASVVIFNNGEGSNSVLSGLTIRNGKAGIGGGIYCTSSPIITNCIVSGNSGGNAGGIGCLNYASPTIINCTISGNSASSGTGGIACLDHSSPTITNCIITHNSAVYGGAIMSRVNTSPVITNCTITENIATENGGGIYCENSSPTITNCILWGNLPEEIYGGSPSVSYSVIHGGYGGTENRSDNPLFVDPNTGNYHLQTTSPCIDNGTNAVAPPEDKDGVSRPVDGDDDGISVCDIGAYEYFEELLTLHTGLNLVGFPLGLEWNFFIDQNVSLVKIQSYQAEISNWLTFEPSYGGNFPFSFGKGWLVYLTQTQEGPKTIDLYFPHTGSPLIFDPNTDLFPGLNLLSFYSLSEVIDIDVNQSTWPENLFEKFDQETGKEPICIIRYDATKGKWLPRYRFFGRAAGPSSGIEKEGYVIYLH